MGRHQPAADYTRELGKSTNNRYEPMGGIVNIVILQGYREDDREVLLTVSVLHGDNRLQPEVLQSAALIFHRAGLRLVKVKFILQFIWRPR